MIELANNVNVIDQNVSKLKSSANITTASSEDQLKEVCNDFEAFFMQQMMDISLKSSTLAGEGAGSDIIKGMYTESLAKSSSGTMGISDMLYRFLSEK
ncbi:MAG: rod-binding protein [Campylobacterota bacterium]|nr:rod-binding protein [Campylobacterota bacterium]